MAHWLATLNGSGLRLKLKKAQFTHDFKHLGVNICCIQKVYLIESGYEGILPLSIFFIAN